MLPKERLLSRLDDIARSLELTGNGLALLALGSAGLETDRLDEWSDLDFFAIVENGAKAAMVEDLGWLAAPCPIAFSFRNTPDGCKLLYEDGVFCEFAVFEPNELPGIPFAPGRVVWTREGFDDAIPAPRPIARTDGSSVDWLVNEALTNLHVGLCRYRRGEWLAAMRCVQVWALDRALELMETGKATEGRDPFAIERRFETRHPDADLARFTQCYDRTPESALALLGWLEERYPVNAAMARAIRHLASGTRVE